MQEWHLWDYKEVFSQANQAKTQYLHFLTFKIWQCPKQLAKNTEKCTINSFFKAEYDPAKIGPFLQAIWLQLKWWSLVVLDSRLPKQNIKVQVLNKNKNKNE